MGKIDRTFDYTLYKHLLNLSKKIDKRLYVFNHLKNEVDRVYKAEFCGSGYQIRVEVNMDDVKKDCCECAQFQKRGVCEHTLALRQMYFLPFSFQYFVEQGFTICLDAELETVKKERLNQLINYYRHSNIDEDVLKQVIPLNIFFKLVYRDKPEKGFYLRLFLNNGKRNYLIKNIEEFLLIYKNQADYQLTQKVSLVLTPKAFSDDDINLIEWIRIQLNILNIYSKYYTQDSHKDLLVDFHLFKELVTTYSKQLLKIVLPNKEETNEVVFQSAKRLKFIQWNVCAFDNENFLIDVDNKCEFLFLSYQLIYSMGKMYYVDYQDLINIYEYERFQYESLRQIYWSYGLVAKETLQNFVLPMDFLSAFFSEYVPFVERFIDINIATELLTDVIHEPLNTKFYFSLNGIYVDLTVVFQYGEITISKNKKYCHFEENMDQLIRDVSQEDKIQKLISNNRFQADDHDYHLKVIEDKDWYSFFKYTVVQFTQFGEVILDDGLQMMFENQEQYKPKLSIIKNSGFLDVSFEVEGIELEDVERALVALNKNVDFVRLNDGRLLDLTGEAFQKASESLTLIRQLSERKTNKFQIPLYHSGQLLQLENEQIKVNKDFITFVQHLKRPQDYPIDLPSGINISLRPYQLTGFRWLKMLSDYHLGGILADEMGLGKTLQTITYLLAEKQANKDMKALIVVPASLVYNWYQECKQFAPGLKVQVVNGGKDNRVEQLESKADVYVTSYQSFLKDERLHANVSYQVLILDEAQMVKNSQTKIAQSLRKLTIPKRFALSGTPVENKLEDLWSIFQVIIPGFFPSKEKFKKFPTELITKMIQPFVLRRTKEEVLFDLPERIETNYFNELSKEQKEIYLAQLELIQETLAQMNSDEFKKNRISILAGLTRLRQICCSPQLYFDDFNGESGKLAQLRGLLTQALENNRRILIFSQFSHMLNIIEEELAKFDIPCFKLDGSISSKHRMEMVSAFNQGEKKVFLISLKAGGTGLNLTGANTVILYDLWWNPAVEDQATSRAHRMGQKEVVEVWRLITKGTIEEKIYELQQSKRELFDQVMQGDDPLNSQLTEEDIRQIFQVGIEYKEEI